MGYPHIEKFHTFTFVCLFLPPEHVSSMVQYLNINIFFSLTDPDDPYKLTEDTRQLGLVVCRGTSVTLICPADGMEAIANPFVAQDG